MRRRCGLVLVSMVQGLLVFGCAQPQMEPEATESNGAVQLRVATYNIEDLRTAELLDPSAERPRAAAALLQELRPDVIVLNEIAYDQPGAPDWRQDHAAGSNAQRFCDNFLAVSQDEGLEPLEMRGFMGPVNTGLASGFDLDNDGTVQTEHPLPPPPGEDTRTPEGQAYGGDTWGFGTYPGQYGMALLVRSDLTVLEERIRTFQTFLWLEMPGALVPADPDSGEPWYSDEEWAAFRLSSKSHWDIPVELPNGRSISFLVSHPTPPAFDGPEGRNQKRNHDEIRFWADYLDGAAYIVDDRGASGGLGESDLFVILGDLNSDPDEGRSIDSPIQRLILDHPRVQGEFVPTSDPTEAELETSRLDADDTAGWGMRVDYVLPSIGVEVVDGGIQRPDPDSTVKVSDHFLVWLDLTVPGLED